MGAIKHDTVADGSFSSAGATAWDADHTIEDNTLVAAKLSATAADVVFGRSTAGAGAGEEIAVTAAARTVLDDATVAAMVDTLGGASSTGTGGLVRATSPTLVTPALGTPASGTLTNCTGLPVAGGGTESTTAQGARANLDTQFFVHVSQQNHNPADGAVQFIGQVLSGGTNEALARFYVRKACRIKQVIWILFVNGTLGTTEQATSAIRVNDTTDTTISAVVQFDAVGPTEFNNTSLDIALAAGEFFTVKITYPTFTTNPTGVFTSIQVGLE